MAPKKASDEKDVWVVIFCGLPGSGKSTLRRKLVERGWAYVCQDEMGKDGCEAQLVKALKQQKSCIIDRCNVTSGERRLWMQHANRAVEKKEAKGVKLHFEAVWMATSPEECKNNIRARKGHETLPPEHADEAVNQFCKGMCLPQRTGAEPYECVQFVSTSEDGDLVLKRYANPSLIDTSVKASASGYAASSVAPAANNEEAPAACDDDVVDTSTPCEVFIMRHGERADRAANRDGGFPHDAQLTKIGQDQGKRAGVALRGMTAVKFAAVYSSPFHRCLQTADEAAAELGLPVTVEPGLSELCIAKIFGDEAPQLRAPPEALQRSAIDRSHNPCEQTLPSFPEQLGDANARVLRTAKALAARHPGRAILLVAHSHTVVELSRHLSSSGGGAVPQNAEYAALSHIDPTGRLVRCCDQTYLRLDGARGERPSPVDVGEAIGHWGDGWCWELSPEVAVDLLLDVDLETILARYPTFREIFNSKPENQADICSRWACKDDALRRMLIKQYDRGTFRRLDRV